MANTVQINAVRCAVGLFRKFDHPVVNAMVELPPQQRRIYGAAAHPRRLRCALHSPGFRHNEAARSEAVDFLLPPKASTPEDRSLMSRRSRDQHIELSVGASASSPNRSAPKPYHPGIASKAVVATHARRPLFTLLIHRRVLAKCRLNLRHCS